MAIRIVRWVSTLAFLTGLVFIAIAIWTVDPYLADNWLQTGLLLVVPSAIVLPFTALDT